MIHTVNASASAAEIRTLHEHYKHSRTVFSIDLPGYGFSERSDRHYNPRLMTDAIVALVEQIHTRCGTAPVDALAASLSCEILARAAMERPTYFRKLALVSPTGFQRNASRRKPLGSTLALPMLHRAFTGPAGAARYFVASRGLR